MESTGKTSNSSDVSSPEINHKSEKSNAEDNTGVGRSYECNFCKRGFTNAQALGGHMNIHRKDKAKAKQKNLDEHSRKSKENYANNLRYFPQVSSTDHHHQQQQQQQSSYYRSVGGQVNYQVYLPSSNPNIVTGNYLPVWRPELFEGHVDANLSLRIGVSPTVEDGGGGDEDRNMVKENEVDLELRLGHDP